MLTEFRSEKTKLCFEVTCTLHLLSLSEKKKKTNKSNSKKIELPSTSFPESRKNKDKKILSNSSRIILENAKCEILNEIKNTNRRNKKIFNKKNYKNVRIIWPNHKFKK